MPKRSQTQQLLHQVSDAQVGLITAAQLAEIGFPSSTASRRARLGGMWNRVLPGVHLVTGGQPDTLQRELAALLYAGEGAVLTGLTAIRHLDAQLGATLWLPDDRFVVESVHVLVPHERRRASIAFVDVERTRHLPPAETCHLVGPLRVAPAARAVCDAARRMRSASDVRTLVVTAVRKSVTSIDEIEVEVSRAQRRGSAFLRAAVDHVRQGVWSSSEADLRELFAETRLPEPLWNPRLLDCDGRFVAIPDAWLDDVGMAVEVDSREHHSTPDEFEKTIARQARYASAGVVCLPLTPRQIRSEPDAVIRSLESAYEAARSRPRPAVRAISQAARAVGMRTPIAWAG